jgi:hypothetical protein
MTTHYPATVALQIIFQYPATFPILTTTIHLLKKEINMNKDFAIQDMLNNMPLQKVELKELNSTQEAQALFVQSMRPPSNGAVRSTDSFRMV